MSKMLKSHIYLNDVIKQFLWAQVFLPISTCALSRQITNYIIYIKRRYFFSLKVLVEGGGQSLFLKKNKKSDDNDDDDDDR